MSGVQEFLQQDTGHFMSLREVLERMAADGASHKEAAQALRRLLMWSPDLRDRPEWVVSGPDELWVAEDEDTRRPWKHLERATLSGLPPMGGRGEKALSRFGFFAGVIIRFLAKHGIDISADQSSATSVPAGAQDQADTTTPAAKEPQEQKADTPPAVSGETPEQTDTDPSGPLETTAPEVMLADDDEQGEAATSTTAKNPVTKGLVAWQDEVLKNWPKIAEYQKKPPARQVMKWLRDNGPRDTFPAESRPARDSLGWIDGAGGSHTLTIKRLGTVLSEWRKAGKIPA